MPTAITTPISSPKVGGRDGGSGSGSSPGNHHSNLLALLDAASRVETLPVGAPHDDRRRQTSGEPTSASGGDGYGPEAMMIDDDEDDDHQQHVRTSGLRGGLTGGTGGGPTKSFRPTTALPRTTARTAMGTRTADHLRAAHGHAHAHLPTPKPQKETFPTQLMRVVTNPTNSDIVTFLPDNLHFVILDPKAFVTQVLPSEFGVSKLPSFTRRLSRWGFTQVRRPGHAAHMAFCHPKFVRGRWDLVATIKSVNAEAQAAAAKREERARTAMMMHGRAGARLGGGGSVNRGQRPGGMQGMGGMHNMINPVTPATLTSQKLSSSYHQRFALMPSLRQSAYIRPRLDGSGSLGTGLKSLAARNMASALTKKAVLSASASSNGSPGRSAATNLSAATANGQDSTASATEATMNTRAGVDPAAHGASVSNLTTTTTTTTTTDSLKQRYETATPLEKEIILQARYAQLLKLQATLHRRAIESQRSGTAGGAILPQAAVDSATRTVVEAAVTCLRRDKILGRIIERKKEFMLQARQEREEEERVMMARRMQRVRREVQAAEAEVMAAEEMRTRNDHIMSVEVKNHPSSGTGTSLDDSPGSPSKSNPSSPSNSSSPSSSASPSSNKAKAAAKAQDHQGSRAHHHQGEYKMSDLNGMTDRLLSKSSCITGEGRLAYHARARLRRSIMAASSAGGSSNASGGASANGPNANSAAPNGTANGSNGTAATTMGSPPSSSKTTSVDANGSGNGQMSLVGQLRVAQQMATRAA